MKFLKPIKKGGEYSRFVIFNNTESRKRPLRPFPLILTAFPRPWVSFPADAKNALTGLSMALRLRIPIPAPEGSLQLFRQFHSCAPAFLLPFLFQKTGKIGSHFAGKVTNHGSAHRHAPVTFRRICRIHFCVFSADFSAKIAKNRKVILLEKLQFPLLLIILRPQLFGRFC